MQRLAGKTCVITGAARGIGRAIAEAFHQEGGVVFATDRNIKEGEAAAAEIGCRFRELDVRNERHWELFAQEVPVLDVMVNNAGVTGFEQSSGPQDPENVTLDAWHDVHRVNLDGTFLGCRYAIRGMKKSGRGSIINISSRSGMVGIPLAAAYASSKAAIRNHTKSVAMYCAQNGWNIRCNSIHPAAVLTPMWEPMIAGPDREERMDAIVADTPLKRFGRPEEIAALAVLLASDEVTYMTGAEITVDGGLLAGSAASPG